VFAEARQAKVLAQDEARRIALNVARLPEFLGSVHDQPVESTPWKVVTCSHDIDRFSFMLL
jgi:hypothetical protein